MLLWTLCIKVFWNYIDNSKIQRGKVQGDQRAYEAPENNFIFEFPISSIVVKGIISPTVSSSAGQTGMQLHFFLLIIKL